MRKKGFEFSFAWLFAIIVGAFILFLAIYGTTKLIRTEKYTLDTITAKQLSIIFEPMETGLASGKSSIARLREETRIYNICNDEVGFGRQSFSLSTKSGLGQKWSERGGNIIVGNKYIFSDNIEQGKEVYLFSKPFELPWKISEIIFMTTNEYCFVNAPDEVKDEVSILLPNVKVDDCSGSKIKVCFGSGSNCDINVKGGCSDYDCGDYEEYSYGYINKDDANLFYEGSLLYAGIFSSKEIYECNVKRLMKRLQQQALVLQGESDFLVDKCETSSFGFVQLANIANIRDSNDLLLVRRIAKEVESDNDKAKCQLW